MDEQLLIRFLTHTCTPEDLRTIDQWIVADKSHATWLFETERIWSLKDELRFSDKKEIGKAYERFILSLGENKNADRHFYLSSVWKYVAVFLLVLLPSLYCYYQHHASKDIRTIANHWKNSTSDTSVQLILPGNTPVLVEEKEVDVECISDEVLLVNSDSIRIDEKSRSSGSLADCLARLIVPKGKRSTLVLEDGTKIWINSGTQLLYPMKFNDERREIYVDGEIYLEVYKDRSRPFIVRTDQMDIQVLGTSFNVQSYKEDHSDVIVLVEGSVSVKSRESEKIQLVPNDMLTYTGKRYELKKVDVSDYISWKEGIYKYKNEYLPVILNRLSRYYGVHVAYTSDIEHIRCSGKLDMQENIEEILKGLTQAVSVDYVKREDGSYLLSKEG